MSASYEISPGAVIAGIFRIDAAIGDGGFGAV